MKSSEIIREARNVLFERGWYQGDLCGPDGSLCLEGALRVAANVPLNLIITPDGPEVGLLLAWESVKKVVPSHVPYQWNDDPERTFSDVLDLFDKAEKLAERAEQ